MNKTLMQAISEEWGRQTLSAHITAGSGISVRQIRGNRKYRLLHSAAAAKFQKSLINRRYF